MKNCYGVDVSYFKKELAVLSRSLPDRTPEELSRYLVCLSEVAKPQNTKERRKTVRAKRPVQQRKQAICARGGKGHYVACRYWHSIGCSYKGKCPHKQHAVA